MAKTKIPANPNLGANLKLLMDRRGTKYTQTDLSQKAGISQSSVGRILRGEVNPSAAAIARISEIFGVDVADLYLAPEKFEERHGDPLTTSLRQVTRALDVQAARARENRVPLLKWDQVGQQVDADDVPWLICPVAMQSGGFAVEVQGVSMSDSSGPASFREGEIAFVEAAGSASAGSFVIAKRGEHPPALRQLIIEGAAWMLVALNPTWPERIVKYAPETDRLLGIVRASLRIMPPAKPA